MSATPIEFRISKAAASESASIRISNSAVARPKTTTFQRSAIGALLVRRGHLPYPLDGKELPVQRTARLRLLKVIGGALAVSHHQRSRRRCRAGGSVEIGRASC